MIYKSLIRCIIIGIALFSLYSCNLAISFIDYLSTLTESGGPASTPDPYQVPEFINSMAEVTTIVTGDARSIAASGDYLYTVGGNGYTNNFNVIDFNNPAFPVLQGRFSAGFCGGIMAFNGYAYYSASSSSPIQRGIVAVNCLNPLSPSIETYTGEDFTIVCQPYYYNGYIFHSIDSEIRIYNLSASNNMVFSISIASPTMMSWAAFQDNYLYVPGYDSIVTSSYVLEVYNVSNPAVPNWKGRAALNVTYPPAGIAVKGDYAYVFHSDSTHYLTIMDISTPTAPSWCANITFDAEMVYMYEAKIYGNYLFACGDRKFYAIDIRDPVDPQVDASVILDNYGGYGFTVSKGYAIVADSTVYRVFHLQ